MSAECVNRSMCNKKQHKTDTNLRLLTFHTEVYDWLLGLARRSHTKIHPILARMICHVSKMENSLY